MSELISAQETVAKIVDTAIRKISSGEQKLTKEYEQSVKEAVNVILNMAQPESCEDAVSRKWLVEAVEEGWIKFDTEKDYNRCIHLIRDIAPSVRPEQKTGEWIDTGSGQECSRCGEIQHGYDTARHYCANCGSDNREGQDGET